MIFVWILVSIFSFSIVYFAPGDPLYIYMTPGATGHKMTDEELDRMRESLGLNGNVVEQYMSWAGKAPGETWGSPLIINGPYWTDPGKAALHRRTHGRFPGPLPGPRHSIGLIAGTHKNKLADNIISGLTYLGISVPAFWLGIMMIIVFSMTFKFLPGSGMRTIGVNSAWDVIQHGIMPALVLSLNNMAVFVRYIRSNTIVQLEEEYVLTAVSKGAGKKRIMYGHVLKNCMLPVITSVGSRLGPW